MSELVMVIEGPEKQLCDIWRWVFDNMEKWPDTGFKEERIDLKLTPEEFSAAMTEGEK